jgi:hypothetical protein
MTDKAEDVPSGSEQECECFHHGMRKITAPVGYIQWDDWAEAKGKTHVQRKCTVCGLYTIWTKKRATNHD